MPNCLPKCIYHFVFPPGMNENSSSSKCSPVFGVVSVLDFDHCDRSVVVSHCFNLHFSDDRWCGTSFFIGLSAICIFSGAVSVKVFGPLLIGLFVFLLFSFKSSLHILNNNSLLDMPFENIFSQSVAYVSILLTVFSTGQKFLGFLKIICFIYLFILKILFIYLFIYGCVGSSFLCEGFL